MRALDALGRWRRRPCGLCACALPPRPVAVCVRAAAGWRWRSGPGADKGARRGARINHHGGAEEPHSTVTTGDSAVRETGPRHISPQKRRVFGFEGVYTCVSSVSIVSGAAWVRGRNNGSFSAAAARILLRTASPDRDRGSAPARVSLTKSCVFEPPFFWVRLLKCT